MTFSDILSAVYSECGYQAVPAATEAARIKRFVNEGVRTVLADNVLTGLADSDAPLTVTSVANQARYVVPEAVSRITGITERTNDYKLFAWPLETYRRMEPDPASNSGTPTHYVPFGRTAVAAQPADASEIFVKSTSASDTGTAYVEGIITGGYVRQAAVTMTGTTAVSLNTAITTFIEITDFYLSANAVGTVTLHEDSGSGTELARITIGQMRPRYTGFYLWPTPAAAIDYLVDYRRQLVDMVADTDEPPLPVDYHHILSAYAVMREWERKADTERLIMAKARFDKLLSQLKYATQTSSDELPVSGRRLVGHSRIGPYYPADTWTRG